MKDKPTRSKKFKEYDWFTKDGELVILNRKALRDIAEGEELISYGKLWGVSNE
jgi:hypothetical protein